jgi:uncharacterized protein
VLSRTAERIAEHAERHELSAVHVVLHGGEPLLAGTRRIRWAAGELGRRLAGVCELDLRIHTNGVSLDRRFLDLFAEYDVKVGISLDGGKSANDLHRRYADGRSSHAKVLRAVALLNEPEYRRLFAGILCTIDVRNSATEVYEALVALQPPRLDFLLPHATWDRPPFRPEGDGGVTVYADWLWEIYQRWDDAGRRVPVRTFDSVLRTLRGEGSLTENLGLEPADLVVVETDGTLEQADSLKTAFDGAPATGLNVFEHPFDMAARNPGVVSRQSGLAGLSAKCRSCRVVQSCGGGLYAHRYRASNEFDNPSVFCDDLYRFIGLVQEREVRKPLPVVPVQAPDPAPDLTDRDLATLASGYGDAATVAALTRSQLDFRRALLAMVWDRSGSVQRSQTRSAWELLRRLHQDAPQATDFAIAHPYLRVWAMRCLSRASIGAAVDLSCLNETAATAALIAGVDTEVSVPIRGGGVRLPGLGRLLLDGTDGEARIRWIEGGFSVVADDITARVRWDEPTPLGSVDWQPVRRVRADAAWTVALEDTDPDRNSHGWLTAERLAESEYLAWRDTLTGAWEYLQGNLPRFASAVARGLRVITPLSSDPVGVERSSASRDAFGAIGVALPAEAHTLALLAVHEFQHVKLGAVLDRYDLFDRTDPRLLTVPWRSGKRPLEAAFQGVYAHLSVAEYWLSRLRTLQATGDDAAVHDAEWRFTLWRDGTVQVIEALADTGALTELGERFVAGMLATMAPWFQVEVSALATAKTRKRLGFP